MSLFSLINKAKIENNAPYWVPYRSKGRLMAREEYLRYFKSANSEVRIVCGECDASFYDSDEFLFSLEDLIRRNAKIYLAFNKKTDDIQEAMEKFKSDNPKLYNKVNSLPEQLKNNVELIWLGKRPEQHYMVIDKRAIAWEEKHKNGEPREIYFEPENPKEAKRWIELFSKLVSKRGKQLVYA